MANKKMLKTYFGLPKTPIDDNTIFYASFDGTTVPEVGSLDTINGGTDSLKYLPAINGLGKTVDQSKSWRFNLIGGAQLAITIDYWCNLKKVLSESSRRVILKLDNNSLSYGEDYGYGADIVGANNSLQLYYGNGPTIFTTLTLPTLINDFSHIRIVYTPTSASVYLDGKILGTKTGITVPMDFTKVTIGRNYTNNSSPNLIMSDVMVSNIDRGNYFPTLPQDFISGKAVIKPAFNGQRKAFADPLTSQYIQEAISPFSISRRKQHTVTQATAGVWANGDTVKVKGLAGEIISGVIDSDTALVRITSVIDGANFTVDDSSRLIVGDTFTAIHPSGSIYGPVAIQAINGNQITTTNQGWVQGYVGGYICEATTSSSVPTMKFNNAGTMTNVTGTWSGLGTNEATFTLGTNAGLTNQDLTVEYSLNMVAGQGGIQEVLTTTLGGEIKAKVYDPTFTKISTDYNGKIAGSVVENANITKYSDSTANASTTLLSPASFVTESSNTGYGYLLANDYVLAGNSCVTNGQIPQRLFSIDIIALVERKYGTIPGATTADKVAWLRANVTELTQFTWVGYGTCPSGNFAQLYIWNANGNVWVTTGNKTTTNGSPTIINYMLNTHWTSSTIGNAIDNNGFMHLLAFTNASNGTIASTIYTDYISVDVVLNYNTRFALPSVPSVIGPRRLAVNPTVHVRDDFKGKNNGSVIENPNLAYFHSEKTALLAPSSYNYASQYLIDGIKLLDGTTTNTTTSTLNVMPQMLFSFNIIEILERKFGPLPCGQTLAEKITWAKGGNIKSIQINWTGYGLGPNGNKAYLDTWSVDVSDWSFKRQGLSNNLITIASLPSLVTYNTSGIINKIDSNGFVHFLAYGDPATQLVSMVPYNPTTWAEWTFPGGAVVPDSTGITFTANGTNSCDAIINTNLKPSTKYGLLYNVVSSNVNANSLVIASNSGACPISGVLSSTVGNQKFVTTSVATITQNKVDIYVNSTATVGQQAKLKDIQIFELPPGSTIEADFTNMTADQLTAKYIFGALPVIPSTLYTDYVNIDLTLNTPTGYDVLTAENPRRDDGQTNILLVRKETKEIQTMFSAKEDDGVVLCGDYVPYQGLAKSAGSPIVSLPNLYMFTTGTGSAKYTTSLYKNATTRLPKGSGTYNDYEFTEDNIITPLDVLDDTRVLKDGALVPSVGSSINLKANTTIYDGIVYRSVNKTINNGIKLLAATANLVVMNGELVMKIRCNKVTTSSTTSVSNNGSEVADYKLPNRPLIK